MEYLTAQYVSAHALAILIPLLYEMIVAKYLGIEVKDLERRMVNVRHRTFKKKKAVVIGEFLPPV